MQSSLLPLFIENGARGRARAPVCGAGHSLARTRGGAAEGSRESTGGRIRRAARFGDFFLKFLFNEGSFAYLQAVDRPGGCRCKREGLINKKEGESPEHRRDGGCARKAEVPLDHSGHNREG